MSASLVSSRSTSQTSTSREGSILPWYRTSQRRPGAGRHDPSGSDTGWGRPAADEVGVVDDAAVPPRSSPPVDPQADIVSDATTHATTPGRRQRSRMDTDRP